MHAYDATIAARRPQTRTGIRARVASLRAPRPELLGLIALSATLNLWALAQNSWANTYYSAAVRSMSSSWHNFLYASFDPSGVMTVDKPPLALWVQALSVRIFGYHPLSILVPEALMGVASVVLIYDLTKRRFGRGAGFVAGLVLATTPVAVAIFRHNNPDALLVLCLTAALWFVVRGLEDGRTRWLVLAGVSIGLGFETKMGAALLVAPAFFAAWLWADHAGWATRVKQTAAGVAAMLVVGAAWPLLVTLTPASSRPWVAGTSDNSIWSLIFGYNGLGRLDGQTGGPGGGGPGGPGGANGFFGGSSGPLRLLNSALGGQAGWLLGFAIVGAVAILLASRLRRRDARSGWLIATGGAFATIAIAFSAAQGIFHPYYTSELAPFTAALVGAGAVQLLRRRRSALLLAPTAIAAAVVVELAIRGSYPQNLSWLPPVLIGVGIAAAGLLVFWKEPKARLIAMAAALAALLIAPASWAVDTLGYPTAGTFPAGGPASASSAGPGRTGGPGGLARFGGPGGQRPFAFGPGGPRGFAFVPGGARGGAFAGGPPPGFARGGIGGAGGPGFGGSASLTPVLRYVAAHGGGTIAVASQSGAASAVIGAGAKVAGIGGFSGRESSVSVQWLANEVRSGKIRWVLDGGALSFGRGDTRQGSSVAFAAVSRICTRVSYSSGSAASTGGALSTASSALYDCAGMAHALARVAK